MQGTWVVLAAVALRLLVQSSAGAQSSQNKDVMLQGQLTPGFDEGVNSSAGITNWVNPNPADNSQKMSCPPNQAWCAMWLSYGPTLSGFPSPGIDTSSYSTLLVELRGDSTKTITIGVKDNTHLDDGTETKVRVLLTTDWRTYAIPLSSFSPSAIIRLPARQERPTAPDEQTSGRFSVLAPCQPRSRIAWMNMVSPMARISSLVNCSE